MSGFADGHDLNPRVGMKIEQVVTDPQHAPLAVDMPIERPFNAGFGDAIEKQLTGKHAHRLRESLAFGIGFRHPEDYKGACGEGSLTPSRRIGGPPPHREASPPLTKDLFPDPTLDRSAHLAQSSLEEVVRSFDEHQFLRFRHIGNQVFQLRPRSELVARSTDEEFGLAAALKK